jgi:aminoglycoside phosphotransferase (APT) family kinase protein
MADTEESTSYFIIEFKSGCRASPPAPGRPDRGRTAYWNELGPAAGQPGALFREPVTAVGGFPPGSELAAEYARASGRDLDALQFWTAFAYWKIAIIVEGVYRRWLNDPGNGSGAGGLQPAVARLAGLAHAALETAPRSSSRG